MGPTVLLTGASSGIGAAAAVSLTRQGHEVLATGRDERKLADVHGRMTEVAPAHVTVPKPVAVDLESLAGVRRLAEITLDRCPRLDVLVNNAGVQPSRRRTSPDGFELNLAVNHLAPFLLTHLLTDRLRASGGRVITTASSTHHKGDIDFSDIPMERGWTSRRSYGRSKLANILFTAELQRRGELPTSCFHPGDIMTDINRESPFVKLVKPFERFVLSPAETGADTLVWLATSDEGANPSACYYAQRKPLRPSAAAEDPDLAARLWALSADMVGIRSDA